MKVRNQRNTHRCSGIDSDWEFFLPDDEETYPEPGDFWIDDDSEEEL